ncbi:DUF2147 domain-containing protein [Roseibacillus persicicus]|uniref:DUF2147 domain-containing protein n=1 Tax=Roseibacillus persicicus TaxID=454148 RepID=A0A918WE87_9BACT|nr:DUF2147 domain-containing protein [Roseibacillus persicicus]GHC43292.1 hypothetical protein GCM10007100_05490 [Roseibacillus persicicus]
MKNLFALILLLICSSSLADAADPILGLWKKSDGQATIQITIEKGKLVGRVTAAKDTTRTHDTKNPDPKLRNRKIIGLPVVWGFYKKDGKWEGGRVYDSSNGKTYQGKIWLEGNDKMMMRGFKGVSLLGRSAEWYRVK